MSLSRIIQAVIFDMDGLIVDTEQIYFRTYNQTLNDHGVDVNREDYVPCVGLPVEENSAEAVKGHRLSVAPEQFQAVWMDRFERAISDPAQIALMPGFLDLLAHLRGKKYILGIASSTPRHRMETTLENGLLPHLEVSSLNQVFGAILSGSDVSRTKPDPEIYLKAAQILGVSPGACVAFEDSTAGEQSAKAAGMTVFAVPNFFTASKDHNGADRVLKSLSDAIPLL